MKKKVLYLDMDGVIADFNKAWYKHRPDVELGCHLPDYDGRADIVDKTIATLPNFFQELEPIEGAIEAVKELLEMERYDVYFLSTPMWEVPHSFGGKRVWLGDKFGLKANKRLILTHRKDLNKGAVLVDDRLKNGVEEFEGVHIHFGTTKFPNWRITLDFLKYMV